MKCATERYHKSPEAREVLPRCSACLPSRCASCRTAADRDLRYQYSLTVLRLGPKEQ